MPLRLQIARLALIAAALLLAAGSHPAAAQAWTFKTLYSFCAQAQCADGRDPGHAALIADKRGELYGTTAGGGVHYREHGGGGTVFALRPGGGARVLYSFCALPECADGLKPLAGLLAGAGGILYGTTYGAPRPGTGRNRGATVFALAPGGGERILCGFGTPACPGGRFPAAALVIDGSGTLYGTTYTGAGVAAKPDCCGTVFKLSDAGRESVLYAFCALPDCRDGQYPKAELVSDTAGDLYGTTSFGGAKFAGTVFRIGSDGRHAILYNFCSLPACRDGADPLGGLVVDSSGDLYGTTASGGAHNGGTVFQLARDGKQTVLYSFCSAAGCADGAHPVAGLVMDEEGALYGTTKDGGINDGGTVFKIAPPFGLETLLYSFCAAPGCADGKSPLGALLRDRDGNLFGTTAEGGANGKGGTVFELERE